MMLSRLDLEAQYLGPLFQMADPIGPLLDKDEEALSPSSSLEATAPASPSLSISSYSLSRSPYQTLSSPTSSVSPPPTASLLGTKARPDPLSLPWLGAPAGDDEAGDTFEDMDWISEKIDLSGLDLHSLIDSCSSGESPSSPEDLLASLDSQMDLDFGALGTTGSVLQQSLELGLPLPAIPSFPLELPGAAGTKMAEEELRQEVVLKSEPPSPAPSPAPPSPVYPLELGSEVDVLEAEKVATSLTATIIPDPSGSGRTTDIVVSLPSSGHIVLVLTNQKEPSLLSLSGQSSRVPPPPSDCDSDSGIESITSSPTRPPSPSPTPSPSAGSSRTKPYSKPDPTAASPSAKSSRIKSASSPPKVVEKKLKKMEQNKTAATRYRQKKRVEQELMSTELQGLEDRNHELAEKAESISREIQYLKDLMEEVRKHRLGKSCSGA